MRIICPTCSSHYEVDSAKIEPNGQLVRCAQCRDVWLVQAPVTTVAVTETVAAAPPPLEEAVAHDTSFPGRIEPGAALAMPHPIDFHAAKIRLRRKEDAGAEERARGGAVGAITIGAAILASVLSLYAFRTAIIRQLPAAGAAYAALGAPVNEEGLALRDIRSSVATEGDGTVLTLEGRIANLRDESTTVPPLTLMVRSESNVPLYTWTAAAPKSKLERGETVAFRSRLVEPPVEGRNIEVSFAAETGVEVLPP